MNRKSQLAHLVCRRPRVHIGQRFGCLQVAGQPFYLRVDRDRQRRSHVVCECDCGSYIAVSIERLLGGRRVSCGQCRNGDPIDPIQEAPPDPSTLTLVELSEKYIHRHMAGAKPGTVARFRLAFRRLRRHFCHDIAVAELTDELVADHFRWLTDDQKLRPASINSSHRAYILAVWRFAMDQGLLDRAPRVKKLPELRHSPDSWTVRQVRDLVDATRIFRGRAWPGRVPLDAYWRALLLVAYWTALRLGSLLTLRMDDVDLDTGWLYVRPDNSKNRRGKRCRIGADAVAAVAAISRPTRELLFEWPHNGATIHNHFRRLQRAAGIPDSPLRAQRFHKMRRTAATLAAVRSGLAAAVALLDHSGPEVTKRYLDPSKLPGCDATEYLPMIGD